MNKFKEAWETMSKKKKITLASIVAATVLIAAGLIIYLNVLNKNAGYSKLFTGLSGDEAQQVAALLQEEGTEYTYEAGTGTIEVPAEVAEQTRVKLLSKGYPKSGFSYDMYIGHAGLMTTESDKKQYTLYDLQDRLGSTIRLFDGVQDAKVTIAQGSNSDFALDKGDSIDASASVVVTMLPDKKMDQNNADAIRNLISRSVKGINFTNVSVFDAATMTEVGSSSDAEGKGGVSISQLEAEVENNIAANVRRVLSKLYGPENLAVSVKGKLDMTKLVQETTQYTVPEKIDQNDKTGLLHHEETAGENSGTSDQGAGGVAGTDSNADTPRYVNQNGTNTTTDMYSNSSATRDWLFNVLKEQREISPGVLTDTSVAVVINTNDTTVPEANLINLVADAAGITRDVAAEKITIVRAANALDEDQQQEEAENVAEREVPTIAIIIMIAAGVLLLLLIILMIIFRRRAKKRKALEAAAAAEAEARAAAEAAAAAAAEKNNFDLEGEQDTNQTMQHGMKLKESIGAFVDDNPQVVAKLIQSWIREEDDLGGRGKRGRR